MRKILMVGGSSKVARALFPVLWDKYPHIFAVNSAEFDLPEISYGNDYNYMDIVINFAAITTDHELYYGSLLDERIIDVNCLGAVRVLNYFLPHMRNRKFGRIIMMSSVYSAINVKGQGVYSASKAFVDKLVKIAALENAEYGITVNSIQLGYTGMGMGKTTQENKDKALAKVGMKRFVTMQELYNTIDYIINTEYLTGQNIRLDGFTR